MVDIVDHALAVADADQGLQHIHDVFARQNAVAGDVFTAQTAVELHATDRGQVVALGREEQVLEQVFCGFFGRRLTRAHHAVNLDQGLELVAGGVLTQRVGNKRTAIQFVGVQRLQGLNAVLRQRVEDVLAEFGVAFKQHLAAVFIDDVLSQRAAVEILRRHGQFRGARFLELADMTRRNTPALLDDDLFADLDIESRDITAQTLRDQLHMVFTLVIDGEHVGVVEHAEDFLGVVTQGAQQNSHRQLATTVNTDKDQILGVKFEVEPGTAVGNDARRVQQLARTVGLALVVIEEHARRAVQLRDDHPLRTVDHKGAVVGHERHFAHVDFLLFDVLDRLVGALPVVDDQAHLDAERAGIGHTTELTFADIEDRRAQSIIDVFQRRIAAVADNGEDGFERRVQAVVQAILKGHTRLRKLAIGIELNRQQVGQIHNLRHRAEVLADAFLLSVRVWHLYSRVLWSQHRADPPCVVEVQADRELISAPQSHRRLPPAS